MKNLIVSLSLVLASGLTSVFAADGSNDPRTEKLFAKQFSGAENVRWSLVDNTYQKVSFTLGGSRAEAYYSTDGELIGTARQLFFSQLPLVVIQAVGNRFTKPVVIEVREITNGEGTNYRLVVEQDARKYNVKLTSLGDISEVSKVKTK